MTMPAPFPRTVGGVTLVCVALGVALPSTGCFRGPGAALGLIAGTAIVTAAIVSSSEPPPPRVIYVPAPQPGYVWEPGYWTRQDGEWVWVEGQWLRAYPGYVWDPTHWVQQPDGSWRLVRGRWVPAGP